MTPQNVSLGGRPSAGNAGRRGTPERTPVAKVRPKKNRVRARGTVYTGSMRWWHSNRRTVWSAAVLAVAALAAVAFVAIAGDASLVFDDSAMSRAAAKATELPAETARLVPGSEGEPPQFGRRRRNRAPRYADPNAPIDGSFVFARIMYQSVRYENLGQGWYTDYPEGDQNYMNRFREFTTADVRFTPTGYPDHVVLTLYDEELFKYPFVFMSDVGTAGFDDMEVTRLREYLLKGGFLWVDDFWGWQAWDHWVYQIGRVLPPDEYPILDVEVDHPIRQLLYPIEEIPQIPSIQWWRRSGRYTDYATSERGAESATPHLRAIVDNNGRVLVLMSHNTDIADGWERENEDFEFFESFSFPAYAVGINVGIYSMTR